MVGLRLDQTAFVVATEIHSILGNYVPENLYKQDKNSKILALELIFEFVIFWNNFVMPSVTCNYEWIRPGQNSK